MHALDLIIKKRDGASLTGEEIAFLIRGYTLGEIPDYQMAAFLMAVFWRGLDFEETRALTQTFIKSGDFIDLREIPGVKVDKHSTGGVGDKTTLVLAPLVAAAGVTVVKMSGRTLGHTGGTLDKLESIPGFRIDLNPDEITGIARRVGAVIAGQTANLVPADKKIYALRDVTGTVDCLPLIAGSIMSKKIAGGADRIVLDVKVGSGGFLQDVERARRLAEWMVTLGKEFRRGTVAVLSSMEQPLGYAVGNSLEVQEAVLTLQGKGPQDLTRLCLELGALMLVGAGAVSSPESGRQMLEGLLAQGAGLKKLRRIISAQGGNPQVLDDFNLLPQADRLVAVRATGEGYIQEINAREIGWASLLLGAGRLQKEDRIDPAAGIIVKKKIGDPVVPGETIAVLHVNRSDFLREAEHRAAGAFRISPEPPSLPPLIYETIS